MINLVYLFAVFFSVSQSVSVKYYRQKSEDVLLFNAVKSLAAFLALAVILVWNFRFHAPTAIYGVLYGVFLAISMHTGYKALCLGPMSLTGMIVSFSVILPIAYGIVFARENPTVFQGVGLVFFCFIRGFTSLRAGTPPASQETSAKDRKKWLVYVFLTFVANGLCSVVQKMHQSAYPHRQLGEFVLYACGFCTLVFGVAYLKKRTAHNSVCGIGLAGFAGLSNAAANFCTLLLAGNEYAAVMYPVISAGTVLAALVCGRVLFGEKLGLGQWAALLCGLAAVVLLRL